MSFRSNLLAAASVVRLCLPCTGTSLIKLHEPSWISYGGLMLCQRTLCASAVHEKTTYSAEGIPLRTGRPRLVVLGTGWAAARLLRDINPKLYDLTNQLYIAEATSVFPDRKLVECKSDDGLRFYVKYDKLVISTGSQGSTFGIPGVEEHAHFLREIKHGAAIRAKLINNVALAGIPGRPVDEWFRLLHIVIVGGGPTGVEVAGELSDFINRDLRSLYPERARAMRITLIEARELLGSFDGTLREYAARKLTKQGIFLRKGVVKEVTDTTITLTDGAVIPYGLLIWSTGVGPTKFVERMPFVHAPGGRLAVDGYMRVLGNPAKDATTKSSTPSDFPVVPDVYALGDCCTPLDKNLPALAQVAEQQGRYLAKVLNHELAASVKGEEYVPQEFVYRPLGSMVTVGGERALLELNVQANRRISLAGFISWVAWRSAYLTRLGSVTNRLQVAFNWTMTLIFGRDMSRW